MSSLDRVWFFLLCVAYLVSHGVDCVANCPGEPDPDAKQNQNSIYHGDPRFIRKVKNAKLYSVGEGDDIIFIVHLWGPAYDMGFAHGEIMKDKAIQFMGSLWDYLEKKVNSSLSSNDTDQAFRPWFLSDVSDFGLDKALDLELSRTEKYTPPYFFDEARGLANATGLDYRKIMRIHMLGELMTSHSSMFGAWGDAVKTRDSILQLRALDWVTDGPFNDFPQITVYHPDVYKGFPFVNIGWTGWIGAVTGYNVWKLSVSEINVNFPDSSFGKESRSGIPYTFLLRDMVQWDYTIPMVETRVNNVSRTRDLVVGIGDGWRHRFTGIQYSASMTRFYNDSDMEPAAEWHSRIKDIIYYGVDWLCPSYNSILARQLKQHYGELSADVVIRDVVPIEQSGSLQVAIFDLFNDYIYVANARGSVERGPLNAYDRKFIRLNGTKLFYEGNPVFRS